MFEEKQVITDLTLTQTVTDVTWTWRAPDLQTNDDVIQTLIFVNILSRLYIQYLSFKLYSA